MGLVGRRRSKGVGVAATGAVLLGGVSVAGLTRVSEAAIASKLDLLTIGR